MSPRSGRARIVDSFFSPEAAVRRATGDAVAEALTHFGDCRDTKRRAVSPLGSEGFVDKGRVAADDGTVLEVGGAFVGGAVTPGAPPVLG